MNQEAIVSDFVERLGQAIAGLLPGGSADAVLEQARRALRQGFDDFDLVPRRELEGHFTALEDLRRTVEDLERRIRELEGR